MARGSWLAAAAVAVLFAPRLVAQPVRTVAIGQSVSDSLTGDDPVLRSRRSPYHLWTLQGRAGQRLVIDLM